MNKDHFEYLATQIFQGSLEVHKNLGPGLLESVYEYALVKELQLRNIHIQYQVKTPLFYKGHDTGKEFFIDILVESEIVIEVKSCEDGMRPVHQAQLLSYLKLSNKKLGYLVNFNVVLIKDVFKISKQLLNFVNLCALAPSRLSKLYGL
jgi:GxxExxY protein